MAEYWKSTPSYWCKFCSIYVRDTGIERRNHEASAKHQNNIQRNLRELQRGQQRQVWEKQRAKDEVARLNGLVGGKKGSSQAQQLQGVKAAPAAAYVPPTISMEAQRKLHAEQLVALGVELPEDLKREVTGVGGWQTVSERIIEPRQNGARTLADVKAEEEDDSKENVKGVLSRGVHKRKAEDEEDARDEEAAPKKKKAWGSSLKSYPGNKKEAEAGDLDTLLSGVARKAAVEREESADEPAVKQEAGDQDEAPSVAMAADRHIASVSVKQEDGDAPPAVVFKKRKVRK